MAHRRHPKLTPLADARAALLAAAAPLATCETIAVDGSLGRITAAMVLARESVPHYHGAAMDGIALRAADTRGASESSPVVLEHGTPATCARPFSWIDTGNALPAWADAVVMIERVYAGRPAAVAPGATQAHPASVPTADVASVASTADDCCAPDDATAPSAGGSGGAARLADARDRVVHLHAAAAPWQHVRLVGEDVVAGELLLPRGHAIRPYDVGALLAAGIVEVAVRPRPVVAIVPTGDELIEPGETRRPGRIVEFNSRMIAAFVAEWGGEARRLAPVGDNLDAVRSRIALAARDADVVCVIAGSSAGAHDFTADALASLGDVLAHGIAVMPGKPAIVAALRAPADGAARVALGIPGYPVSAAVICRELLSPLLAHLVGTAPVAPSTLRALTPRRLRSRPGQEELLRVTVGEVGGRLVATPLARGAGAITSMVRADGIVRLGADVEVVEAGEEVEIELLRPPAAVRGTIVLAGLHDPVLGVLEDVLRSRHPGLTVTAHSLEGAAALAALECGEVYVAAVRVARVGGRAANVESDEIVSLLRRLHASLGIVVLNVVRRQVGLMVAKGNPLGICAAEDLLRPDVRTPPEIERSGVRYRSPTGATASGVVRQGDEREMTLLELAAAVQSGLADAVPGTAATASMLGLGFVPISEEEYLLVLRTDLAPTGVGRAIAEALSADQFRRAAQRFAETDATLSGARAAGYT